MTTPDSTPIADRVRFWEEQDKINQELIPRVIRQNELLTAHIADHDSLVEIVSNTMQQALADNSREQQQQYDSALEAAKTEVERKVQDDLNRVVASMDQKWRKTRNLLIGITTGAVAIGICALIVGILI